MIGEIPSKLGHMKSLTVLDLSFNQFSGRVPSDGQLKDFNDSVFAGNPNLCSPHIVHCPTISHFKRHSIRSKLLITVICLISVTLFMTIIYIHVSKKKHIEKSKMWKLTAFQRLDFKVDEVVSCLKDENVIGKGGAGIVYRGSMPNGVDVAIKRLVGKNHGFDAEIQTLGRIKHRNIVRLLGYVSNQETNILLYEYMSHGSLGEILHGSKGAHLQWETRYKIAIESAKGLCYLHHDCSPLIVHRDVKSNNILLDSDYEAHVADFGLAKFAPEGATHLSTRVAGTMGYVAPEYALYGQLTERSDVYSFGVVLLEVISGKKALLAVGDDQPVLLADWAWSMVRNGTPLEVIDDSMAECGPPEIMEKYVLVAVLSSHPQLYARPTMDQVLKMLDTDLPVPSIPERPIPLTAGIEDIERSVSESGSGHLSTPRGYQTYTIEMDGHGWSGAHEKVAEEEEEKARLSGGR